MLNRRHIRIKVMQQLFELSLSKNDDLNNSNKKLNTSFDKMYDLYLLQFQLFVVIFNKAKQLNDAINNRYIKDDCSVKSVSKLLNNVYLNYLANSKSLHYQLESRQLTNWELDDEYATLFLNELLESEEYDSYINSPSSFEEDRTLMLFLFKSIIAPNDKLFSYYEDTCISWIDDLPAVNTTILKSLKKIDVNRDFKLVQLFKDEEDIHFAKTLLDRTFLNDKELSVYVDQKTPKWDADRIANIDAILMKMAICEFLKFPSIPVKVTINEYIEIAKEYSTKKSSTFINGILDNLAKEFKESNKLQKMGRGLM